VTLTTLIRKRGLRTSATAISATSATKPAAAKESIAGIATVAVANPERLVPANADGGWLLHFANRDPLEIYDRTVNQTEILSRYPDALAPSRFRSACCASRPRPRHRN
jgi:hypothetical protein